MGGAESWSFDVLSEGQTIGIIRMPSWQGKGKLRESDYPSRTSSSSVM